MKTADSEFRTLGFTGFSGSKGLLDPATFVYLTINKMLTKNKVIF
jgi:hypothetical protein